MRVGFLIALTVAVACTSNPYPAADADRKVLHTPFTSPPRTLDPAVAYSTTDHAVSGNIFDTLLKYHYLKRPYTLMPGLAEEVPDARAAANGHISYRFRLRPGVPYQDDPCF